MSEAGAGSFTLDMGAFMERLKMADTVALAAAKKGLWEGAAALKKDADEIVPKTPHLHGNLRGNARRGVKAKGSSKINKDWWPKYEDEDLGPGKFSVLVAYCAPYAHRWHEAVDENVNWSEASDGVGPKYLEAKISRKDLRDKYYGIIANRIKEELSNA
jgi:hypothetical protein